TPLLLKNLGSRLDLFDAIQPEDSEIVADTGADGAHGPVHLMPIRITQSDLDAGYLMDGLASFSQIRIRPCLVLDYSTVTSTFELVTDVVHRLDQMPSDRPLIWLTYNAFHDRNGVDQVIARSNAEYGINVQPILMP